MATLKVGPAPKHEAPAAELAGTLTHPDRSASVWSVRFSPDGKRLFTAGYPSGVVQFWDVATQEEARRITTPPGFRSSGDYTLLTDDWKTLYVPTQTRAVTRTERDGKPVVRVAYTGAVRVWDVATGKERPALASPPGSGPSYARFGAGQKTVLVVEDTDRGTGLDGKMRPVVWDLATGRRRLIGPAGENPFASPDGRTLAVTAADYEAMTFTLRLLDAATGAELARLPGPPDGRVFSLGGFSPDSSLAAIGLGGKKGGPVEVWFRDGQTLADRGRYVAPGDPDKYSWATTQFLPGNRCAIAGGNKLVVWDVAAGKTTHTLDGVGVSRTALSPDGKTLAVAWAPPYPADLPKDPDPEDLPQPRVTLVDLAGTKPPRTLLAPPGYVGGVALSPDNKRLALGGAGATHLFDLSR